MTDAVHTADKADLLDSLHGIAAQLTGARLMAERLDEQGTASPNEVSMPYELSLLLGQARDDLWSLIESLDAKA